MGDGGDRWLSVNLSPRQIADPDLVEVVTRSLDSSGLPPEALFLEITETALFEVTRSGSRNVSALKALGVRLVLDDFGTGYSSLSHLKEMPVDMIKIDRSFVASMGPGRPDGAIVSAVLLMGAALGLDVVAEGVEHERPGRRAAGAGVPARPGLPLRAPAWRPPSRFLAGA